MPPGEDPTEPTNGELAVMIRGIDERLKEASNDVTQIGARLGDRLGVLSDQINSLQLAQATDRERLQAQIDGQRVRMDSHDKLHERQDTEAKDRKERSVATVAAITGLLTAGATIAAVIVTLVIAGH